MLDPNAALLRVISWAMESSGRADNFLSCYTPNAMVNGNKLKGNYGEPC